MSSRIFFRMLVASGMASASLGLAWAQQPAATKQPVPTGKQTAPATRQPAPTAKQAPGKQNPPAASQPAASAKPAAAKPAPPQPPADPNDAARKNKILNSPEWRRAMFELAEWLSAQPFYNKQQVQQIKANLSNRVKRMSADELEFMLADLEAKFQVMETPEAKEARAWIAQYLSVASEKKREEILREMPNLTTMTAAQLSQELNKIQQKHAARVRQQAAFDRARSQRVDASLAADKAAQQAAIRDQNLQNSAGAYYSPYRNGNASRPFDNVQIGPSLQIYSGGYGGPGVVFSPNRW